MNLSYFMKISLVYVCIFLGSLFLLTNTFLDDLNNKTKIESKVKFVYGAF